MAQPVLLQDSIAEAIQAGQLELLPDAQPVVRKRAGKACDACRTRRVRCQGGVPCEACKSYGLVCNMRLKARPKRSNANGRVKDESQSPPEDHGSSPGPSSAPFAYQHSYEQSAAGYEIGRPYQTSSHSHFMRMSAGHKRQIRPMADLEAVMADWCIEKTGSDLHLELHDSNRLARFKPAALLPSPLREEYETSLIESLTAPDHISSLDFMDSARLMSIYRRYRALPETITADHRALINASFCVASFELARTKRGKDGYPDWNATAAEETREDITYFRIAMAELEKWNRPSIPALWAMHCLKSYAGTNGGVGEVLQILAKMTEHLKEFGLHRQATAALYPEEDYVFKIFFSCFYEGTFTSGISDGPAHLQWGEFDIDPLKVTSIADARCRVAIFESQLVRDIYSDDVDTTTPEYVLSTEARWMPLLKEVQKEHGREVPRVLMLWAAMRLNWLYILLRAPCIHHPTLGHSSAAVLAVAAQQILWIYAHLQAAGRLNPAWSQIRRIVTAGHVVILCLEEGQLHRAEAEKMLGIIMELLDAHRVSWPEAEHLQVAFSQAAAVFGINVEPRTGTPVGPTDLELGPYLFGYSLPHWEWDTFGQTVELDPNGLSAPYEMGSAQHGAQNGGEGDGAYLRPYDYPEHGEAGRSGN